MTPEEFSKAAEEKLTATISAINAANDARDKAIDSALWDLLEMIDDELEDNGIDSQTFYDAMEAYMQGMMRTAWLDNKQQ